MQKELRAGKLNKAHQWKMSTTPTNRNQQSSKNVPTSYYQSPEDECDTEGCSLLSDDALFFVAFVVVEALGALLMVLVIWWMAQMGGFGFEAKLILNFHPPLMTMGMIFLNANGEMTVPFLLDLTINPLPEQVLSSIAPLVLYFTRPRRYSTSPCSVP